MKRSHCSQSIKTIKLYLIGKNKHNKCLQSRRSIYAVKTLFSDLNLTWDDAWDMIMNCIFIWVESVPGLNMLAVFLYAGALKSVQCSWFYCLNHDLYFYYPRPLYILYFYPPDLSRWKSKYWMLISPPGIEDGRLHDPAVVLSLQCVSTINNNIIRALRKPSLNYLDFYKMK